MKVLQHSRTFSGVSTIKSTTASSDSVESTFNNLHMSEYQRFAGWVKKQQRCPEDAWETTMDIKFVRSKMKGIGQSKGTPATAKKTDTEQAKAFLLKCYMPASMSLEVLDESSSISLLACDEARD